MTTEAKQLLKLINNASRATGDGSTEVFLKMLNFMVHVLSLGKLGEVPDHHELYVPALKMIGSSIQEFGEPEDIKDILGELYMLVRSEHKGSSLGQYFTPWPVAKMMAMVVNVGEKEERQTIFDPTCGSGVMLLAAASSCSTKARFNHQYYGGDLDYVCVMMSCVQCALFGMNFICYHANMLSCDVINCYEVRRTYIETHDGQVRYASIIVKLEGERLAQEVEKIRIYHKNNEETLQEVVEQAQQPQPQISLFDDLVVPTEKKQSAPAKKKVKPITNNQSLFD